MSDVEEAREYVTFPLMKSALQERAERAEAERDEAIALLRNLYNEARLIVPSAFSSLAAFPGVVIAARDFLERNDSR